MAQNAQIVSLPYDVLRQIFSLVFLSEGGRMTKELHRKVQRLALVCEDWGEIISSMGELYATFQIHAHSFPIPHRRRRLSKFMEKCIQSSGNYPLYITVCSINDLVVAVDVFKVLQTVSVSHRLKYLSIKLEDVVGADKDTRIIVEGLLPIEVPNLQRLSLTQSRDRHSVLDDVFEVLDAPSLTRLDLDLRKISLPRASGKQTPWCSLTHLSFGLLTLPYNETLEFLSLMTGLRSLEIFFSKTNYMTSPASDTLSLSRRVVLEELRYLKFDAQSCTMLSRLVNHMHFPRLELVYYDGFTTDVPAMYVEQVRRILRRLPQTVTELKVDGLPIGLGFSFAHAFRNLRKLTLDVPEFFTIPSPEYYTEDDYYSPPPPPEEFLSELPHLEELWLYRSSEGDELILSLLSSLSNRNKEADLGNSSTRPAKLVIHCLVSGKNWWQRHRGC
ncbi:hypothetical protein AX17_005046 [Amanita inopinata Kibby_2008]|nr:hypothetical protein AX17_005046 [Amanita inopinata Kibby_2008]